MSAVRTLLNWFEYQLYLPKKELFENKVEEWVEEFEKSKKVLKDEL